MILQSGIKKIHYLSDYRNDEYAINLIEQAGASVHQVKLSKKYFSSLQFGDDSEFIPE